ncbi:MAG: phosphoribosylanthranilate isomerase [Kiritimatiellia bacterium]
MRINGLKICGISDPDTALFCAEQGVGAVGIVFFPKSPRNVTAEKAAEILSDLPEDVAKVGVFVNMPPDKILELADKAGLTTVQMHGNESADDIRYILNTGYRVIKVLKSTEQQLIKDADCLPAGTGIMVELSGGNLPGGNGYTWNWSESSVLAGRHKFALAGGLCRDNLREVLKVSGANALDLSSAVEKSPGIKDRNKIIRLVNTAEKLDLNEIFWR